MGRKAVVVGATGLVGRELVLLLAQDKRYDSVTLLVRRPSGLARQHVVDILTSFDDLSPHASVFKDADVFCSLGTTIKKAGSQEAFRAVDFGIPMTTAKTALAAGASRFILVSAVGASSDSPVFYNRVKGDLEGALRGFSFPGGVAVMRPSLLLGQRAEARWAERVSEPLMGLVGPLLRGPLAKYKSIQGSDVAKAMLSAAWEPPSNLPAGAFRTYEGDELFGLAQR